MTSEAPSSPANFSPHPLLRRPAWLGAIVLTLVLGIFHGAFLLQAGGFWRDEVNLINVAQNSTLKGLTQDSFPLLMPLLVKIWSALDGAGTDFSLRLLGALIGLGGVVAVWLASWAARREPPLLALVLWGLNSTVITFGDSLRAYGLGSLMIGLMFAGACVYLRRPDGKNTALLALCAVLAVQSLFHNAVLVGAICLGAMAVCVRRGNFSAAGRVFLAGLVAAVSLLPYVANFIAGRETVAVLRTGLSWTRFVEGLQVALGFPTAGFVWVWAALALAAIGLAVAALRQKTSAVEINSLTADDVRLLAGVTVLLAAGGFLGFLWLSALPGQPWYFLPLLLLVAMCAEAALGTLGATARKVIFIGALGVFAASVPVTNRDLHYRFTNVDGWAKALNSGAQSGDYIIVTPWFTGITFAHYFSGPTPWTTLPPLADHAGHRYDQVRDQMLKTNALAEVRANIAATLRQGGCVWLLCPPGLMRLPPPGAPPPPDLPPPPLPQTGWQDDPYSWTWTMQVIHQLANSGTNLAQIPSPHSKQRIAENLGLFRIQGWQNP